jgi:hypothetical protein
MDPRPSFLFRAIETDNEHILKFEYLVKMFYNEHCDHFESDNFLTVCGNRHFPSVFLK